MTPDRPGPAKRARGRPRLARVRFTVALRPDDRCEAEVIGHLRDMSAAERSPYVGKALYVLMLLEKGLLAATPGVISPVTHAHSPSGDGVVQFPIQSSGARLSRLAARFGEEGAVAPARTAPLRRTSVGASSESNAQEPGAPGREAERKPAQTKQREPLERADGLGKAEPVSAVADKDFGDLKNIF